MSKTPSNTGFHSIDKWLDGLRTFEMPYGTVLKIDSNNGCVMRMTTTIKSGKQVDDWVYVKELK